MTRGTKSFVHGRRQNMSSLSRMFLGSSRIDLFLVMSRFVPPIMKNGMPVNDITMKYC